MSGIPLTPSLENSVRIAMWSGPRNISTAMMRAFEARGDCAVLDEPFYAHYLTATDSPHPIREEVIAHHESDWRAVVQQCTGPIPNNKTIYYQKHMCHHMLPEIELDWLTECRHAMLVRDPCRMLISLNKIIGTPTIVDTGLPQQLHLFNVITQLTGSSPPVFDAKVILTDPPAALRTMCDALDISYTDDMLAWETGHHSSDGIWGPHWYANLYKTTGFTPYAVSNEQLPQELHSLLDECNEIYAQLTQHRTASL